MRSLEIEPAAQPEGAVRKAVVVEIDRHIYALMVDAIEDVVVAESDVAPPPGKLLSGWERCALGIVETPVGALLLADPAALIAAPGCQAAA